MFKAAMTGVLAIASAMALQTSAHAFDQTLTFKGVAVTGPLPRLGGGSEWRAFSYADGNDYSGSFVGDPVSFTIHVTGSPGDLYVDSFLANWGGASYSPQDLSRRGDSKGGPQSSFGAGYDFLSDVDLTGPDKSIHLSSTADYAGATDGGFALNVDWTNTAHGRVGSGTVGTALTGGYDPVLSYYDGDGGVYFALVPEPSAWAVMLLGSTALGVALRRRRGRMTGAVSA
jgi:hypothetical protein